MPCDVHPEPSIGWAETAAKQGRELVMAAPEISGEDADTAVVPSQDGSDVFASAHATDLEPLVGIHAVPGLADEVAGSIIRARRRGYDVVVSYHNEQLEGVEFARHLGASLLPVEDQVNDENVPEEVTRYAKSQGYPGVVYQEYPAGRIDYEASIDELMSNGAYLIQGRHDSGVREQPRLLVAIPAFNEGPAIAEVVARAQEHADQVVVIDDGSEDDTAAEATRAGAAVIEHERNRGYGAALQTAFVTAARCNADHLTILDGDGQHRPEDIPRLLDKRGETGSDVVIGSRLVDGAQTDMPAYRRVGLAVVNVMTNVSMIGLNGSFRWITDTQSGFRLYNRRAIESLAAASLGDDMDASTDILYHASRADLEIAEVGVTVSYDVHDANSQHPVSHGLGLVSNIINTLERDRPMAFVGMPGWIMLFAGCALGYASLSRLVATQTLPIGMAASSLLLAIAGLFLGVSATVSRSVGQHTTATQATSSK